MNSTQGTIVKITTDRVRDLRDQTGAGVMDCRKALLETEGHMEKALQILKQQSLLQATKKVGRSANQGIIEAYIHGGGRIGAIVEVNFNTTDLATPGSPTKRT